jgi:hypothetical protein
MKRRLKATEWMTGALGVTAAFCAVTGDIMQFSICVVASVFWFVVSRVK